MEKIWKQLIAVILGGFLAGVSGWFVDWNRETKKFQKLQGIIITAIRDDLEHSIWLYDKFGDEFEKTTVIWPSSLIEFQESRQFYQKNREWMTIFDNEELRKKIFKYYFQSGLTLNLLDIYQKKKYELEKKIAEKIAQIEEKNPNLGHKMAVKEAREHMENEGIEYSNLINNLIPQAMSKAREHRFMAADLLKQLPSIKH